MIRLRKPSLLDRIGGCEVFKDRVTSSGKQGMVGRKMICCRCLNNTGESENLRLVQDGRRYTK